MKFGQRFGDPFGDTDAQAIFVTLDDRIPAARNLSWTPEHSSGVIHHVMFDQVEYARTSSTSLENIPTDARDHIEVIETSDQNALEDVTNVASTPLDTAKLTWDEVTGTDYYELYKSTTSATFEDEAIGVIHAGESSYAMYDRALEDDTYYYRLVAYDDAGNTVNSNDIALTVTAAPNPPTNLTVTVT